MPDKTTAAPPTKKARRLKNAETIRERALKASQADDKPKRRPLRRLFGPTLSVIGRILDKIFNRQPFKLIGRLLLPRYLRNSWKELRLVTWPTLRQSRDLTFAVLLFAVVFGGLVALVDYGLDKVFKQLLLK